MTQQTIDENKLDIKNKIANIQKAIENGIVDHPEYKDIIVQILNMAQEQIDLTFLDPQDSDPDDFDFSDLD